MSVDRKRLAKAIAIVTGMLVAVGTLILIISTFGPAGFFGLAVLGIFSVTVYGVYDCLPPSK